MSRYQIAGGAIVVIGIIGILYGPQGTGPWSTGCIGAAALGLALMIFGGLFGVEEKLKKAVFSNFFKSAIAVVSFFAMMLGMLVIMIYYAGSIVDLRPWLPYAFIGLAAGVFGFYYGSAYKQNVEMLKLAEKIGLEPARTGMREPDGKYDIKGVVEGVEVLADLEEMPGSRNSPASFNLEILCRVGNPLGVKLKVSPEGALGGLAGGMSQVPYWDWYSVKTNNEGLILQVLPAARQSPGSVFGKNYGFLSMELKGGEFKFSFGKKGHFEPEGGQKYVKKITGECAALAKKFS
ncbi:MAG: hypothetical protein COT17_06640 [Elusimicrobia bacterium CG08_land_8_20_14_0_20_51_18]|nr:MAG: hypothetical protein COT17_06640 [Elusimicrobia bacterium CG08_land_8_20_14_0_20_51_18]